MRRSRRRPPLIPLLAILVSLATATPGQVPEGHVLVTLEGSATQPQAGLAYLEPLRGAVIPVGNVANQPWSPHRAVLAGSADLVLLAVVNHDGTTTIVRARLAGAQLVASNVFATGLRGAPTGIVRRADAGLIVCTTHTIYAVGPAGGIATPLINATTPLGCVDSAVAPAGAIVLAVDSSGASPVTTLYEVDTASLQITPRPINLPTPARSLAGAPALGGYFIGDALGTVHLVDQRWVATVWANTGLGPINSLVHNNDQKNHVLGVNGAAHVLTGTQVGAAFAFANAGALADLDYAPYRSTFAAYGAGCAGSSGMVPILDSLGRPFPGNASFAISLARAAPNSRAALFAGFQPLNFDLAFLGMPLCPLLLQPAFDRSTATGNGSVLLPFPIPPLATLVGNSLFCQWFVVDPGSNQLGVVTSNGGRADF